MEGIFILSTHSVLFIVVAFSVYFIHLRVNNVFFFKMSVPGLSFLKTW